MKKLFSVLLLAPLFVFAQDKTVINISRVFPKADKIQQFEKALASHVQKYHKGDWAWRVSTIETGPDMGGYNVVEGPGSWEKIDGRNDISKEHQSDWDMNVQPLLTDRGSNSYANYRAELSTVKLTDYADKVSIQHIFHKPGFGYSHQMENLIKSMKKAWESAGQSVAVYENTVSGEPGWLIVTRYKSGLKEIATGGTSFETSFTKANGAEEWNRFVEGYKQAVDHQWTELTFLKKDLSSK